MDGGTRLRGSTSGSCPLRSAYRGKPSPHLFTSEILIWKADNDGEDADYWAKICSGCGLPKRTEGVDPRRSPAAVLADA